MRLADVCRRDCLRLFVFRRLCGLKNYREKRKKDETNVTVGAEVCLGVKG